LDGDLSKSAQPPASSSLSRPIRDVLVIGGGLAGMSAACALSHAGYRVDLLERRPYLGGRASSYQHPGTGEVIDNSQHVLLGCCTNLKHFYKRIGVDKKIDWTDHITFLEPGGRRSVLQPNGMPAPWHSTASFFYTRMLGGRDKFVICRALGHLLRGPLADTPGTFADWLHAQHQTAAAVDRFWRPILVSALNDEPENVSAQYGSQIFHEALLKSPQAGYMGLSTVPLGDLYARATTFLQQRQSRVRLRASIERARYDAANGRWIAESLDERFEADAIIFALPFQGMQKLLPEISADRTVPAAQQLAKRLEQFEASPITGIHLWLDKVITDLPHAALLDSPIHWMFHKSRIQPATRGAQPGSYIEVVVSASTEMVKLSRQQILDLVLRELPKYFPAMHSTNVTKSVVVKEVNATFRSRAGIDRLRPSAVAPWPRSFLAGDWTATGWPSTMESAVRSGNLAAEALCKLAGRPQRFLQPDMKPTGLMRVIARRAKSYSTLD
jgi:squalene-associated FAD-dependent desaturase